MCGRTAQGELGLVFQARGGGSSPLHAMLDVFTKEDGQEEVWSPTGWHLNNTVIPGSQEMSFNYGAPSQCSV